MEKSATLPYFMEIRGLGIIDIKTLYGLGAVRINKKLDIIIELKEQERDNYNYSSRFIKVHLLKFLEIR